MAKEPKGKTNPPKWPTLEEQLAESKVVHGSALEKLVKANQDANLLRPEEANNDGIGLPLWLRVYYRKRHPNEQYSPASPAGDYPDVLGNMREWMMLHQDLPPDPSAWLHPEERKAEGGEHGN